MRRVSGEYEDARKRKFKYKKKIEEKTYEWCIAEINVFYRMQRKNITRRCMRRQLWIDMQRHLYKFQIVHKAFFSRWLAIYSKDKEAIRLPKEKAKE